MSDRWTWIATCALAAVGFFASQAYFQPSKNTARTGASRIDAPNASATNQKTLLRKRRAKIPHPPVRLAGSARKLTRQEKAGVEAGGEMNSMRNALGLAMQADAMSLKRCVASSEASFVDVLIRFQVSASKIELQARAPQLFDVPNEAMSHCILNSLAEQYSAETTEERPFLDGYRGELDIRATINAAGA